MIKATHNQMTIALDDFLGLELECFYCYEPPLPADDINPPEQAVVLLEEVRLGEGKLVLHRHLNSNQWLRLEQEIFDRIERE